MTAGPATFTVAWGVATDAGRRRRANEDCYLAAPPLFVVADGMGGHEGGAAASAAVVDAFRELTGRDWLTAAELLDGVVDAGQRVEALAGSARNPPGSTLTGVGLLEQEGSPCWLVFNIGDSRAYRFSGADLEQVSVDHSRVQELVDAGEVDIAHSKVHGERNIVTRALGGGMHAIPALDQWLLLAAPGDRILLCSDGLTGELTDTLIAATLSAEPDPQRAADELLAAALVAGGRDNVTILVVDALEVRAATNEVQDALLRELPPVDLDAPTGPQPSLRRGTSVTS